MPDLEKVIKGLQIERECVSSDCDRDCGKCDLVQDRDWLLSVYDEAIELLKEQESTTFKPRYIDEYGSHFICGVECGSCHEKISKTYHYCPYCGKVVKWE